MQSWIHVIEWRATVHPDVTALVDDRGVALSYAGLRAALERRAGGWAGLAAPGDVVAIVAKNSADFLVHALAIMRAGATPALLNWRLSAGELAELRAWLASRGRSLEAGDQPRQRLDRIFLERVGRSSPPAKETP